MHLSLRSALLLMFGSSVAAGACGGNVVVDPQSVSTGGATTTSTTGFGAAPTTSTTGFGNSTTNSVGAGGSITTVGPGGGTTTSSSSSVSSTSGGVGACTDPSDDKLFVTTPLWSIEVPCVMANLGNQTKIDACIATKTGLGSGCLACLDADLQCAVSHCLNSCASSPTSQSCADCRLMSCAAAFVACSGRASDTGITNCSTLLGNGPGATPWKHGLDAADFTTQNAYNAYSQYDGCVCTGACAGPCAGYCGGQTGSSACAVCVKQSCPANLVSCETN
jgi:hypothetical protein